MYNSEFEQRVQEKLDGLSFTPSDAVWDKVAAGLPAQSGRRRLLFLLALLLVPGTGTLLLVNRHQYGQAMVALQPEKLVKAAVRQVTADSTAAMATRGVNIPVHPGVLALPTRPASTFVPVASGMIGVAADHKNRLNQWVRKQPGLRVKQAARTTVAIAAPTASSDAGEGEETTTDNTRVIVQPELPAETMVPVVRAKPEIIAATVKADTSHKEPPALFGNNTAVTTREKRSRPWTMGITLGMGLSSISRSADASKSRSTSISGSPPVGPVSPVRVSSGRGWEAGTAFSAGVYWARLFGRRWVVQTGLQYQRYAAVLNTGQRIDSATFSVVNGLGVNADYYYKSGGNNTSKVHFGYIGLPLTVQYNLNKKGMTRYFAEAGLVPAYLLSSNTLLENYDNGSFYPANSVLNRWNLGTTAGFGIRWPAFTLGTRGTYAFFSGVNKQADRQHPFSVLLYGEMPLRNIFRKVQRK